MTEEAIKVGDRVRLLSKPSGSTASMIPVTVGKTYIVQYVDGSNVCTTTDVHEECGYYWRGRVEKVN